MDKKVIKFDFTETEEYEIHQNESLILTNSSSI